MRPVTACSTGAHAIGDAARLVAFGDADVMLAGGAEGSICEIGIAGVQCLQGVCRQSTGRRRISRRAPMTGIATDL